MSYYTATFLVGAHRFGVLSPKLQKFSEIFWALHIDHINTKDDIRNFCLFVYLRSYNDKSIIKVYLIFLYTLEKIPWKNYVRFWKWNLKRTPQSA